MARGLDCEVDGEWPATRCLRTSSTAACAAGSRSIGGGPSGWNGQLLGPDPEHSAGRRRRAMRSFGCVRQVTTRCSRNASTSCSRNTRVHARRRSRRGSVSAYHRRPPWQRCTRRRQGGELIATHWAKSGGWIGRQVDARGLLGRRQPRRQVRGRALRVHPVAGWRTSMDAEPSSPGRAATSTCPTRRRPLSVNR